jgi:hypothetical protein
MPPTLRFDHAIIAVFNLNSAIADYRALGFTPFIGGKHASGLTHNALIVFQSGDYLELLAPTDPGLLSSTGTLNSPTNFLSAFQGGEGLAGYAFLSTNLQADVNAIRKRGLNVSDPKPNSRLRPDGERLAWRGATLDNTMTPFFIEDETPRVLRVSQNPKNLRQPNSVTGVASIVIVVSKLEASVAHYQAILGLEPQAGSPVRSARTADFTLGSLSGIAPHITLAEPNAGNNPLRDHLTRRGDSLYLLRLRTSDNTHTGLLDMSRTHGARIELVK